MKERLRQFIAPDFLVEDEPLFTLDQNGGLVVDLDVLIASGRFDQQLEGVARLRALSEAQAAEAALTPRKPKP